MPHKRAMVLSRRQALRVLAVGAAGIALDALARPLLTQQVVAAATITVAPDAWSSLVTFRTAGGWYASPVHATVMPDGRLVCYGIERSGPDPMAATNSLRRSAFRIRPTPLGAALPAEITVESLTEPVDANNLVSGSWLFNDDLFCAGNSLTSDGKLFTTGGTRAIGNGQTGQVYVLGLSYATLFDGQTWSRVAADSQGTGSTGQTGRWYPTATRLSDGRMLVTSGFEAVQPNPSANLSAEIFSPTTGTWAMLGRFGQVPLEILNSDYTHVFQLPQAVNGSDLLMFGEPGVPVLTSSSGGPWVLGTPRTGSAAWQAARIAAGGSWDSTTAPDSGASTTLLPIRLLNREWGYGNGSVLVTGGPLGGSAYESGLDVYDPAADAWLNRVIAPVHRHYPTTVLLPDSRVLIICGAEADPGITVAEYVDPAAGFGVSLGQTSGTEIRGYHNVAVLLPDGSVLVGGGRDLIKETSGEKPTFRYYYPSYMFANRPTLMYAPASVQVGTGFLIETGGSAAQELQLMSLPSMTHSFNMDQRMVQLKVIATYPDGAGHFLSVVMGPTDARVAPPGYYMLFAVDGQRIPSQAKIMQVLPAVGAAPVTTRAATMSSKPLSSADAQSILNTLRTTVIPRAGGAGTVSGAAATEVTRPSFFCPIRTFVYDR